MNNTNPSLYEQVLASNIEHDSFESNLYVKLTTESQALIKLNKIPATMYEFFHCNFTKNVWINFFFAYDPYWVAKNKSD